MCEVDHRKVTYFSSTEDCAKDLLDAVKEHLNCIKFRYKNTEDELIRLRTERLDLLNQISVLKNDLDRQKSGEKKRRLSRNDENQQSMRRSDNEDDSISVIAATQQPQPKKTSKKKVLNHQNTADCDRKICPTILSPKQENFHLASLDSSVSVLNHHIAGTSKSRTTPDSSTKIKMRSLSLKPSLKKPSTSFIKKETVQTETRIVQPPEKCINDLFDDDDDLFEFSDFNNECLEVNIKKSSPQSAALVSPKTHKSVPVKIGGPSSASNSTAEPSLHDMMMEDNSSFFMFSALPDPTIVISQTSPLADPSKSVNVLKERCTSPNRMTLLFADSFDHDEKLVVHENQRSPARTKVEKARQPGWDCEECAAYYRLKGKDLGTKQVQMMKNKCSRHRKNVNLHNTPEGFWNPMFTPSPTKQ